MLNSSQRPVMLARYIIATGDTVRGAASEFGIGKSTVHTDVTKRLRRINPALFRKVDRVLQKNKDERHIRGGIATKNKYLALRQNDESEPE